MAQPTCPRCGLLLTDGHQCGSHPDAPDTGQAPDVPRLGTSTAAGEDSRSFTERYRGTEWDSRRWEPAPTGTPRSRNKGILAALLLVVIAFVGAGYALLDSDLGGPEAPAGAAFSQTLSARPSVASSPTPKASPAASSSPTRPSWRSEPSHPAMAFIAYMSDADRSMRIESQSTIRAAGAAGAAEASISASMDISGADWRMDMTYGDEERDTRTRVVVKDGVAYSKMDHEPWQRSSIAPPQLPIFGETAKSFEQLEYVGPASQGGRELHHLRLPTPLPAPALAAAERAGLALSPTNIWDIWVTRDGHPDSARFELDVELGAEQGVLRMVTDYAFSQVGDKISIKVPSDFRGK